MADRSLPVEYALVAWERKYPLSYQHGDEKAREKADHQQ
jgi:hypothetical protein